jgi:hypothetical protein
LDCALGSDWRDGNAAPSSSCATFDATSCYCGSLSIQQCVATPPEALAGECTEAILNAAGCSNSACVSSAVFDAANPAGAALQYIQCEQNFCFDDCFTP